MAHQSIPARCVYASFRHNMRAARHEELIITRVAPRRMKLLSRRGSRRFIRAIRAAHLPKIAGIRVKL